jgi:hypothetical protein
LWSAAGRVSISLLLGFAVFGGQDCWDSDLMESSCPEILHWVLTPTFLHIRKQPLLIWSNPLALVKIKMFLSGSHKLSLQSVTYNRGMSVAFYMIFLLKKIV